MLALKNQKLDTLTLALVAALAAGLAALSVAVPQLMPWSFVALGAGALLLYWSIKWEVTAWTWVWVLSYGLLNWPSWRVELTGFFNLTVPRMLFGAALAAFLLHYVVRRPPLGLNRALIWVMLGLLVCCGASATATGWRARTAEVASAPYFRFIGSLVLPFAMFFMVYVATSSQKQIRWALIALTAYGWYALYIGYLQYAAIMGAESFRSLIWPGYINDPSYGIHFDRARGAFAGAPTQAVFLVLLFYVNLFLLRHARGGFRALCLVQAILIPPAIFFTGVRSAYVAFLLCGVVWCLVAGKGRFGGFKLTGAAVVLLAGVLVFWPKLARTQRRLGGVAQRGPVVARLILLEQTWQIVRRHPFTGVGFGHFVDAQVQLRRDPGSLAGMSYGVLVEHNLFLNMAAETGLIGLSLTVAVFVLLFGQSRRLYRRLPPPAPAGRAEPMLSRAFVALFWVALVNYITDAMFRDPLWDVFTNGLFWSLAALVVGYNRLLDSRAAGASAGRAPAPEGRLTGAHTCPP